VVLPDGRIMVVGGSDSSSSLASRVDLYDTVTNTWSAGAPLPTPRSGPAVVLGTDGRVYVFGGGASPNRVEAYDPVTNTWSVRAAMPTARGSASAATLPDGRIYVFGGGNCGIGFVRTIDVYIPASDSWGTVPGSGVATSLAVTATGADGLIYLLGGYDSCYSSSTIQTFTPATGALTPVGTLTPGVYGAAGTVAGNNIYVGGGLHTTFDAFGSRNDSVVNFRRFNATTRAVVGLYDIPAALTYGAMVAHPNGRIYWIGGRRDSTVTPTALVWAYLPTLDQWWQ
jgi:N-acetylneuraminic acid mutarotase